MTEFPCFQCLKNIQSLLCHFHRFFPFFSGEGSIKLISFLRGIPQECLCFGSSSLPGPYLAEDIPAGVLLCDYRNWHQPTRCFIGEQRCSHDLPRISLIAPAISLIRAPALYFHLSCSLSEDSVNNCLREDTHCIFTQKAGKSSITDTAKLMAAIPFAKI